MTESECSLFSPDTFEKNHVWLIKFSANMSAIHTPREQAATANKTLIPV